MVNAVLIRLSLLVIFCSEVHAANDESLNGFIIDEPLVPASSIFSGGPPRDGIPSIDQPQFLQSEDADFLSDADRVIGVSHRGIAKAYPIRILNRHEIVNDEFEGHAIVVTFCPLCGSGMVFDAAPGGESLEFGVSGLLYNSDVLLYDRRTESLWSQILSQAVSGPMKGTRLQPVPSRNTTWRNWRRAHPDSLVMSEDTGYRFIDYSYDPYQEYKQSQRIWFPLENTDRRLPAKDWVLGVSAGGAAKAFPLAELSETNSPVHDAVGDVQVRIEFDPANQTAVAFDESGQLLPAITLYWFAWAAFHPDTQIYSSSGVVP